MSAQVFVASSCRTEQVHGSIPAPRLPGLSTPQHGLSHWTYPNYGLQYPMSYGKRVRVIKCPHRNKLNRGFFYLFNASQLGQELVERFV